MIVAHLTLKNLKLAKEPSGGFSDLQQAIFQLEIEKPRISSTSVYRQNPDVENTEDYFRVTIYNQLLDDVIQQLDLDFVKKTRNAANFDILLPLSV